MYHREFEKLMGETKDSFDFLYAVSSDASARLTSRIFTDEQNIKLKEIPIGGENGLPAILLFIPLAMEGFTQDLKSDQITKNQIFGLLETTMPTNLSDVLHNSNLNYLVNTKIYSNEPSLSIFRHSLTTFIVLSGKGRVDSGDLNVNLIGASYWPHKPTKEDVWNLLTEIGRTTRQLLTEKDVSVRKDAAYRAAHFFAAGSQIAKTAKGV